MKNENDETVCGSGTNGQRVHGSGLRYRIEKKGVVIAVKVIPKASKNEITGIQNGELKLKITAPPEKGKANAESIRVLSGVFDVAKNIKINFWKLKISSLN